MSVIVAGKVPHRMYVCICNAVTEDDVHGCMASGACVTAKDVRAACGMKPGCGNCTKRLHAMISEYRTASDLADALTGGPASLTAVPGPAHRTTGAPVFDAPAFDAPAFETRPAAGDALVLGDGERGTAPQTAA
ncbi:(2Fe-2S)-binding protein [Actinomadura roseirufa]|uniref:(2Fe-2S)-binding protein n=1 Tax=Actinomadura roseirufa TaxID=2094049 RepID=UPI001A954A8A|nr:(2Fe-2S)-binding protein [Actinomadura roseirufa]